MRFIKNAGNISDDNENKIKAIFFNSENLKKESPKNKMIP
jgi:hypothetical protein